MYTKLFILVLVFGLLVKDVFYVTDSLEEPSCFWRYENGTACTVFHYENQCVSNNTGSNNSGGISDGDGGSGGGGGFDMDNKEWIKNELDQALEMQITYVNDNQIDSVVLNAGQAYSFPDKKIRQVIMTTTPPTTRYIKIEAQISSDLACYQTIQAPFPSPHVSGYQLPEALTGYTKIRIRWAADCVADDKSYISSVAIDNQLPTSSLYVGFICKTSDDLISFHSQNIDPLRNESVQCIAEEQKPVFVTHVYTVSNVSFMIQTPWPSCYVAQPSHLLDCTIKDYGVEYPVFNAPVNQYTWRTGLAVQYPISYPTFITVLPLDQNTV